MSALNLSEAKPKEHLKPLIRPRIYWAFADAVVMGKRNLKRIPRSPDEIVFATIQPVMFVLLFRYVFGGAITGTGTSYVNYLMAGIFVQTVAFGSTSTGVGLVTDLQQGLIDRFRSLPMAKSAVLTGRIVSDLLRNTFVVMVMWTVGLLVDFRPEGPIINWFGAVGMLLLTSFVFSWIGATIGLLVNSAEAANSAGFIWLFPLTFASSAFAPTEKMPDWLRVFADHQPITLIVNSIRGLLLNHVDLTTIGQALVWCVGVLIIFVPLSVWLYQNKAVR